MTPTIMNGIDLISLKGSLGWIGGAFQYEQVSSEYAINLPKVSEARTKFGANLAISSKLLREFQSMQLIAIPISF